MAEVSMLCGTVEPRAVIFKIARHTGTDVQISYEHFGSDASATDAIKATYQKQFPHDLLTVVKYIRA